jgi:CRP/FNR family transcriptional regulator, cyclic AMP receptor protein
VAIEAGPGTFAADLSPEAAVSLAAAGRRRVFAPGARVFRQGDEGTHVLLLTEGWVKIVSGSSGGTEVILAIRGAGDLLGELSAVDGGRRSAAVDALDRVVALELTGPRFLEAVRDPEIGLCLIRHLARHLRDSDAHRLAYASTDTFRRLVRLLLTLSRRHGRRGPDGVIELAIPLTRLELAAASAMSREMLMRGLRTLRQRDVVRTRRGGITIARPAVLELLAEGLPER